MYYILKHIHVFIIIIDSETNESRSFHGRLVVNVIFTQTHQQTHSDNIQFVKFKQNILQ